MEKYNLKWWKEWLKTSTIRAIYTFCQGLLGMIAGNELNCLNLNWGDILLTCLTMALLSYAKSFVLGVPEMKENN